MSAGASLAIAVCFALTAALLYAEWRRWFIGQVLFKLGASTAFVMLAMQLGAADSPYGRWVLAALVLSWLGDAFLLSSRGTMFLSGMASFLAAHLAYAIGFSTKLAVHPAPPVVLPVGFVLMAILGVFTLRWLWPHLQLAYKVAVGSYVVAIAGMCALALAAGAATGSWLPAIGALVFAASDLAVARNRFVTPGFINGALGLPMYYFAQILLAFSAQ